jgi:tRNA A37 threonylcarbamoyladenosine synthetase subunit TsaC/SUA5/YrdC
MTCPMDGRTARHLVLRTAEGPVTLFLLADDPSHRRRSVTEGNGMAAVTMPAAKGSIAIVATRLDQALRVERSLLQA